MPTKRIESVAAPKPIGPYSQAISAGNLVFVSGQIALDPSTGKLVNGGIKEQVERIFASIESILKSAGLCLGDIVKNDVYLKDMGDFKEMNEVYAKFFSKSSPARQTIQAAKLPMDALIEISCIAYKK